MNANEAPHLFLNDLIYFSFSEEKILKEYHCYKIRHFSREMIRLTLCFRNNHLQNKKRSGHLEIDTRNEIQ